MIDFIFMFFQRQLNLTVPNLLYCTKMKAGLGLPDIDSWNMIEKIAERNNLGYKQLVSQTGTFAIENWLL